MSAAPGYYRARRRQLRRRGLCIRCGEHPAEAGCSECALCLAEKKLKRPDPPAGAKQRRIAERISKIDSIRARLAAELR